MYDIMKRATHFCQVNNHLSSLLQEGFLVRDTRGDDKSDWAIKAFPKLRKLALVQEVIRKARGTE